MTATSSTSKMIPRVGLEIELIQHGILHPSIRMPIIIDSEGTTVGVGGAIAYTVAF